MRHIKSWINMVFNIFSYFIYYHLHNKWICLKEKNYCEKILHYDYYCENRKFDFKNREFFFILLNTKYKDNIK